MHHGANQVVPMQGKVISIARDWLSHSLSTRLILIRSLDPRLACLVGSKMVGIGLYHKIKIYNIVRNLIEAKWYYSPLEVFFCTNP